MTEVLTYEALKAKHDALEVRLRNALSSEQESIQRDHAANQTIDALAVENAALINSSVCTLQDGRPQHGFYASEWFIAKLKNGQYAALKALPEEYSHDYRTNDGTYYTKDWVVGWMQTPDTEYRPNVKTPATDAALATIRNEATARALKHLCDCQLISATVAELKADELREAK
ncbi:MULTISPECIES: hypothetical protein [unclassified Serratia (in: enterobacteria)]|uniref:hypothetical protein n=1 Tax=unclassified Serratia (in: enterobacteria) TaxID=2647522 RepID=UPI0021AD80EF|nr:MULTISPECIES: hypothetical protein [unclassified Serratia (in: enterobacteria)]